MAFGLVAVVSAHESERTEVTITFSRDGSFVVDIANDPNWFDDLGILQIAVQTAPAETSPPGHP